jgi:hypothetical protein
MLNEVIVVVPTLNVCVFETVYLNSSVKNCGCFKFVFASVILISYFVHCVSNVKINCRLKKENVACFDEGYSKQRYLMSDRVTSNALQN